MSRPVRSGSVLPSLKMITPVAPAACAFATFCGEGAGAALDQDGMARDLRPEVSSGAAAAELGVVVGGSTLLLHRGERLPAHGAEALPRTPVHAEHEVRAVDAHRRDAGVGVVVELVLLQVHVVARRPASPGRRSPRTPCSPAHPSCVTDARRAPGSRWRWPADCPCAPTDRPSGCTRRACSACR